MDRERPSRCTEGDSISVHTFISRTLSIHQGLYKVAEAIGTMIQNIKYISIYKYTAKGRGTGGTLGMVSQGGLGGRVGIMGGEGLLTFDLDDRREENGYRMRTPTCSQVQAKCGFSGRAGLRTLTRAGCVALQWPCCCEGPRHGKQRRPSKFSAV